jgi:hypothetical protein
VGKSAVFGRQDLQHLSAEKTRHQAGQVIDFSW